MNERPGQYYIKTEKILTCGGENQIYAAGNEYLNIENREETHGFLFIPVDVFQTEGSGWNEALGAIHDTGNQAYEQGH